MFKKLADAFLKGFIFDRFELVEQRGDHLGIEPGKQKLEQHEAYPGRQPPQAGQGREQLKEHGKDDPHDQAREQQCLYLILEP